MKQRDATARCKKQHDAIVRCNDAARCAIAMQLSNAMYQSDATMQRYAKVPVMHEYIAVRLRYAMTQHYAMQLYALARCNDATLCDSASR